MWALGRRCVRRMHARWKKLASREINGDMETWLRKIEVNKNKVKTIHSCDIYL
jgi:hypothetical protein